MSTHATTIGGEKKKQKNRWLLPLLAGTALIALAVVFIGPQIPLTTTVTGPGVVFPTEHTSSVIVVSSGDDTPAAAAAVSSPSPSSASGHGGGGGGNGYDTSSSRGTSWWWDALSPVWAEGIAAAAHVRAAAFVTVFGPLPPPPAAVPGASLPKEGDGKGGGSKGNIQVGSSLPFREAVLGVRQCRALGLPAAGRIAEYIQHHHEDTEWYRHNSVAAGTGSRGSSTSDRRGASGDSSSSSDSSRHNHHRPHHAQRIIYSCESNKKGHFCGGLGDRMRGIATVLYLAILANRRFELFHPVPSPLQRVLTPHLLNWIPTTLPLWHSRNTSSSSSSAPSSSSAAQPDGEEAAVARAMAGIPADLSLMRLQRHRSFLRRLDATMTSPSSSSTSLRLQSNSAMIDAFITAQHTPRLAQARTRLFAGPSSSSSSAASAVNMTAYFGCLYELLFAPSAPLLRQAHDTLSAGPPSRNASPLLPTMSALWEVPMPSENTFSSKKEHGRMSRSQAAAILAAVAHRAEHTMSTSSSSADLRRLARGILSSSVAFTSHIEPPPTTPPGRHHGDKEGVQPIRKILLMMALRRPYISVQVRVGGPWAAGLHIPEPFRTPPAAVAHIFDVMQSLQTASTSLRVSCRPAPSAPAGSSASADTLGGEDCDSTSVFEDPLQTKETPPLPSLSRWPFFVSSDAEKFVRLARERFDTGENSSGHATTTSGNGGGGVLVVKGDSFQHTDTLNAADVNRAKFRPIAAIVRDSAFAATVLNHWLLGLGRWMVMAQSGFGDTAHWRMRRGAAALFVDMTNSKLAWQHLLAFDPQEKMGLRGLMLLKTPQTGAGRSTSSSPDARRWLLQAQAPQDLLPPSTTAAAHDSDNKANGSRDDEAAPRRLLEAIHASNAVAHHDRILDTTAIVEGNNNNENDMKEDMRGKHNKGGYFSTSP